MEPERRECSGRELNFLMGELAAWREAGLISPEQETAIRGTYAVRTRRGVLLAVGAALVGLGFLSLVAANWHSLSLSLRILLIVAAYLGPLFAAYACDVRAHHGTAAGLRLLASFAYGGGLFLMSRMFHPWWNARTLSAFWIIGVLPLAALFRDDWQLLLAQALSLAYLIFSDAIDILGKGASLPPGEFFMPPRSWPLLATLWAVWLLNRHPILDRGRQSLNDNALSFHPLVLLTLWLLESRVHACFGASAALLAMGLVGAALSFLPPGPLSQERIGVVMMGGCGLALTYPECWRELPLPLSWQLWMAIGTAVLLGLALLWRLHRGRAWGGAFLALLAARYLFDGLLGSFSKAWGFTIIGVLCLGTGWLLEHRQKNE